MGEDLFFILFEVTQPLGAVRLPACFHVPLTRPSHIPAALHRCVSYLTKLGAGDSWGPRSERRAMASPPSCRASTSTPRATVGMASLDFFFEFCRESGRDRVGLGPIETTVRGSHARAHTLAIASALAAAQHERLHEHGMLMCRR